MTGISSAAQPHERWPEVLWLIRHGQSAGNVARDAADAAGDLRIALDHRDVDVPFPISDALKPERWATGLRTVRRESDRT